MCCGPLSAAASGAGFSTGRPMIGSTISANFAGCAVDRKTPTFPVLPVQPVPPREAHVRNRAVGIEQIAALLVDLLDRGPHLVIREPAARHVAAHGVAIVAVQPQHALEVARVPDIHRIRERRRRRARLVVAGLEIRGDDVVDVGGGDETRDRQTGAFGHQAGGQVAEISARRAKHDVRGRSSPARPPAAGPRRGSSRPICGNRRPMLTEFADVSRMLRRRSGFA